MNHIRLPRKEPEMTTNETPVPENEESKAHEIIVTAAVLYGSYRVIRALSHLPVRVEVRMRRRKSRKTNK